MQQDIQILEAGADAELLLHPVRMQVLEQLREPASAAEVARALNLPRQRVGHHVRLLQAHGLLERVGERRNGNFVEQLLRAKARAYVVAPQALGGLASDPATVRDRFSSEYLAAAAADVIRSVAVLRGIAHSQGKRVPTLTLETEVRFRSAEQQSAFADELRHTLADLVRRYHEPAAEAGRTFRFTLAGHPALPPNPTDGVDDEPNH